jgi:hypothetical protein
VIHHGALRRAGKPDVASKPDRPPSWRGRKSLLLEFMGIPSMEPPPPGNYLRIIEFLQADTGPYQANTGAFPSLMFAKSRRGRALANLIVWAKLTGPATGHQAHGMGASKLLAAPVKWVTRPTANNELLMCVNITAGLARIRTE